MIYCCWFNTLQGVYFLKPIFVRVLKDKIYIIIGKYYFDFMKVIK